MKSIKFTLFDKKNLWIHPNKSKLKNWPRGVKIKQIFENLFCSFIVLIHFVRIVVVNFHSPFLVIIIIYFFNYFKKLKKLYNWIHHIYNSTFHLRKWCGSTVGHLIIDPTRDWKLAIKDTSKQLPYAVQPACMGLEKTKKGERGLDTPM